MKKCDGMLDIAYLEDEALDQITVGVRNKTGQVFPFREYTKEEKQNAYIFARNMSALLDLDLREFDALGLVAEALTIAREKLITDKRAKEMGKEAA